jgi:hypothetical protein
LESAQKTSKRDFSSSMVISSVVLWRDFSFDNDEERDALLDNVYDTAQHFVSQYDFSLLNESDDNGSPGV